MFWGANSKIIDIEDLEFNYSLDCDKVFAACKGTNFDKIVRLYPLEWIAQEIEKSECQLFADDLEDIEMLEPAWKLLLGNKAILPVLWEMFPGHRNLLPAYFDDPRYREGYDGFDDQSWISKPKFGREGHGVLFSSDFRNKGGFDEFVART